MPGVVVRRASNHWALAIETHNANMPHVDHDTEITRLRGADLSFRSDMVAGPGGRQILLADPAGNLIELFHPPTGPTPPPRPHPDRDG